MTWIWIIWKKTPLKIAIIWSMESNFAGFWLSNKESPHEFMSKILYYVTSAHPSSKSVVTLTATLDSLQKSSQAQANKMQILGSRSHTHTTITLLSKLHANFCFSLLPRTAGYNGGKIFWNPIWITLHLKIQEIF